VVDGAIAIIVLGAAAAVAVEAAMIVAPKVAAASGRLSSNESCEKPAFVRTRESTSLATGRENSSSRT
jgi:hypothetical protein